MFDLIFDGFTAFNAIGFLIGGVVLLLIAACFLGYWAYWRVKSVRVKGRIVAVKSTGQRRSDREWEDQYKDAPKAADEDRTKFFEGFGKDFKESPFQTLFAHLIVLMVVLVPVVFFVFGAWMACDVLDIRSSGTRVPAKIVAIESEYDSDNGTSYYPVVSFRAESGETHRRRDRLGSGSPSYKTGESVFVFYDPDDPERFVIDSFWRYMGFSLAFMGIGGGVFAFMFGGLFFRLGDKEAKDSRAQARKKMAAIKRRHYANQQYIPVYEFIRPGSGETVRVEGEDSSAWLADKMPGRTARLMVMPGRDGKVTARRPGLLSLVLGVVFLAPGGLFLKLALGALEFNAATVLVFIGLAGFLAFKMRRVLGNRASWPPLDELKRVFKARPFITVETPDRGGYEMTAPEIRDRVRMLDRNALLGVPVVLLIGIGMMGGGFYLFRDMNDLSDRAMIARGEVVDMNSRYDSSSDGGGYTYYPVVAFETTAGETVRFEGKMGSNPPAYRIGDRVTVLYDPDRPQRAVIDHGWLNWLPSVGLGLAGLLCSLWALKMMAGIMARSRRV